MPAAAYLASMPPPGTVPGSTMGVSGGGGDPRLAFVVDVEAVEAKRFTPLSMGILRKFSWFGGGGRALLLLLGWGAGSVELVLGGG